MTYLGNRILRDIEGKGGANGPRDGKHESVLGEVHAYKEGEELGGSYVATPGQLIVNGVPLFNGYYAAALLLLGAELDRRGRKTPFRESEVIRMVTT